MARYPTPNHEGHWWAKLIHPSRMPDGEDWKSVDWEVVQVFSNGLEPEDEDERWGVHVPGITPTQWLPDFVWGPEVPQFKPATKVQP